MMNNKTRQQGMTLLIVLIMLVIITLVSITSFKLGSSNLQVVGNMQVHNRTTAAAQGAVENTVSNAIFTTVVNVPVTSFASVGGSTTNDIQIVTTPTCVEIQPITNSSLNLNNPNDVGCIIGANQQNGIAGASSPNSMCSNSVWDIQAVATDLSTNAASTINQGEAVRVPSTADCP